MNTTIIILLGVIVILAVLNLFFLYVNTKVLDMLYNVLMQDYKLVDNQDETRGE